MGRPSNKRFHLPHMLVSITALKKKKTNFKRYLWVSHLILKIIPKQFFIWLSGCVVELTIDLMQTWVRPNLKLQGQTWQKVKFVLDLGSDRTAETSGNLRYVRAGHARGRVQNMQTGRIRFQNGFWFESESSNWCRFRSRKIATCFPNRDSCNEILPLLLHLIKTISIFIKKK